MEKKFNEALKKLIELLGVLRNRMGLRVQEQSPEPEHGAAQCGSSYLLKPDLCGQPGQGISVDSQARGFSRSVAPFLRKALKYTM